MIIGGGIIGCSAAAILASRGARVSLVERTAIAAGASGRNLGAIQHPFDAVLAPLYRESLVRYQALADETGEFAIGAEPAGLMLLNRDEAAAAEQARRQQASLPELLPRFMDADEVARVEPSLSPGLAAVRLATGFPVPPASATAAWARLAEERGARVRIGSAATPVIEHDNVTGVQLADGTRIAADAVLVAAGPWTPPLVDPSRAWEPIRATWGVTVQLRLDGAAPRHIVEEDEVDAINRSAAATARAAASDAPRKSRRRCSVWPAHVASVPSAPRSCLTNLIHRASQPCSCDAALRSSRQSATRRWWSGGSARVHSRWMADPSSGRTRGSVACMSVRAMDPGGSVPAPLRRPWQREPSWMGRRRHASWMPAAHSELHAVTLCDLHNVATNRQPAAGSLYAIVGLRLPAQRPFDRRRSARCPRSIPETPPG